VLGPLFVITRLYVSVPPAVGVALPAVLTMLRSADGATASASAAEQTPPVQDVDGFEFVTPVGGVIETVLVTPVWACAHPKPNRRKHTTRNTRTSARQAARADNAISSADNERQFKRATSPQHLDRAEASVFQKLRYVTKSSPIQSDF
jgi:hypothetical protein